MATGRIRGRDLMRVLSRNADEERGDERKGERQREKEKERDKERERERELKMQEIYVPLAYEIVSWGGLRITVNRFYSTRTTQRDR